MKGSRKDYFALVSAICRLEACYRLASYFDALSETPIVELSEAERACLRARLRDPVKRARIFALAEQLSERAADGLLQCFRALSDLYHVDRSLEVNEALCRAESYKAFARGSQRAKLMDNFFATRCA